MGLGTNADVPGSIHPEIKDIERKIRDHDVSLIVLINPNNPTGALYSEKTIRELINIAGQYDLPIVSDEIYDLLTYEKKHVPLAKLAQDITVLTLNGVSKTMLSPGWRTGWIEFHDPLNKTPDIWDGLNRLSRIRLSAPSPQQITVASILSNPDQAYSHIPDLVNKLRDRRDFLLNEVKKTEGIEIKIKEAA